MHINDDIHDNTNTLTPSHLHAHMRLHHDMGLSLIGLTFDASQSILEKC